MDSPNKPSTPTSPDSPKPASEERRLIPLAPGESLKGRKLELLSIRLGDEVLWENGQEISPEEEDARIGRALQSLGVD
jgi:hypothetical protein